MSAPPDFTDDADDTLSYRRIYDIVVERRELILTIPTDSFDPLKKNLSTLKSREAAKFKSAGLVPSDEVLSYNELPCNVPDCTRVHIILGARQGVRVIKMELPDDKL